MPWRPECLISSVGVFHYVEQADCIRPASSCGRGLAIGLTAHGLLTGVMELGSDGQMEVRPVGSAGAM